jgi:peroxiredoxin
MSRPKNSTSFVLKVMGIVSILIIGLWAVSTIGQGEVQILRLGDSFPELSFPNVLNTQERAYLSLGEQETFTMKDFDEELLVVEFLNKYCFHCQVQAPVFVMVYNTIQADPELRNKVRMIGIGAGNTRHQLEVFREETGVQFPLVPDADFVAYDAVGSPKTPFTLLLRKDTGGNRIVASAHRGVIYSDKGFVEEIKAVLQYDVGLLTLRRTSEEVPIKVREEVKPDMTEEELVERVTLAMEATGGTVTDITKINLTAYGDVYIGDLECQQGRQKRFAKVISRASFCDVCHDIHYIYVFNREGTVLRFDPIHLTKKGNWEWDEKDVEKMRGRLQGKSLLEPFDFDPEVDAITAATISSQLIFRSLGEGQGLFQELRKEGYIN